MEPVTTRDRGLDAVVVVNGKAWSDKSRSQQERFVKKIGAHMQDALYTAQPNLPRSTFTVRLPLHLSAEPRLELDLTRESIDLSKARRIDARLYGTPGVADAV